MKKGKEYDQKYLWIATAVLYLVNLPLGLVGLMLLVRKKLWQATSQPKQIDVSPSKTYRSNTKPNADAV